MVQAAFPGSIVAPDEVLARRFDQTHEFPGLHVARVVFDGDLHVGIFRFTLDGLEQLDHRVDVTIDASVALAVAPVAEVAARHGAAQPARGANQQPRVVLGRAPLLGVVRLRGGTDARRADLQFDPRLSGLPRIFSR